MVRLILVTNFEKENTKNRREEKEKHEICRALREACCYFRACATSPYSYLLLSLVFHLSILVYVMFLNKNIHEKPPSMMNLKK